MPAGRPSQFDPDLVVRAALRVFWSQGYAATSLQDLLEAMHLSKSSLYSAFGGKQRLFARCLTSYADSMVSTFKQRLDASESPLEFIQSTLIEIGSEGARERYPSGCLIMNAAAEFGLRDPDCARWVQAALHRIRSVMVDAVERAQIAGELSRTRHVEVVADFLMSNIAGLRIMVKAGTPTCSVLHVVELVVASLN